MGEEAAAEEEYDEEEEEEEEDEEEETSLLESPIYSNIPGWQLWQVYPCPWLATVSLTSDLSSGLLPNPTKSSPSPTPTNVARLCIFNAGISCCNKFDFDTLGMEAMTQMELLIQKNIIFVTTQTSNYVMHSFSTCI